MCFIARNVHQHVFVLSHWSEETIGQNKTTAAATIGCEWCQSMSVKKQIDKSMQYTMQSDQLEGTGGLVLSNP